MEEHDDWALEELRKRTWRSAEMPLWRLVGDTVPQSAKMKDRVAELNAQIFETVAEKWAGAGYSIGELLAKALHGDFNIAARAVVDDLKDRARHETRRDKLEILFTERDDAGVEPTAEAETENDALLAHEVFTQSWMAPDDEAEYARQQAALQKELSAKLTLRRYMNAVLDPQVTATKQNEIAEHLGVTDRTVRYWERELDKIVKKIVNKA
jgi:hypothetical protein